MVKHQGKDFPNFKNIYGDSLILNISRSTGCLKVSIQTEKNSFTQKSTVFIGSICAIAALRNFVDSKICLLVIGLLVIYFLYEIFFFIKEENVLFIKGFGCHISRKHWFGEKTKFIPHEQIQKVFINEVIFRHRVVYLLTLLTKQWTKDGYKPMVPLFLNLLPRIDCLQIIYKDIKNLESR